MTRAKRLEPVQHIVEEAQKRLAMSVAAFEKRVLEGEAKLVELERYKSEYEQGFSQRAGRGIGVAELRDYQAFLAKLAEAIKQQQALVNRARAEHQGERAKWQEALKRSKALGHVVERWQAEERHVSDRREQRDSDERAQRKTNRP
ncbi:flagellar export protein FliJ [Steroidobacter sp. S1-65]|uniref:Flagellar FliJ protein n=1 Tax=Steroidobacter gossypii TaxID=2805490 RepID=A0ABS1X550_9GAMM|nr:flagellar export protein FliJ [Steroidobacter gossypii]MBM0108325.1 flagellar export protein FliJ [Steroidobacter gossypii]